MSRALWFAAGAGAGVYVLTRARRAAEVLTPEGLADRLAGLSVGARIFTAEVRAGMVERENDVRARAELSESYAARADHGADNSAMTREGND